MPSEVLAMALSKLGELIELVDERNSDNHFTANDLKGISINKLLVGTKADTTNLNLSGYKVVKNNWFTYCTVTSRNGNKISIAYNDGADCIVSSINPVFKIKDETRLLPRYLMMVFNRAEFDRYARFNSWGSARETFSWEDMCAIVLDIPSIDIQKKYVAMYEGLLANLHTYEKGLDDLKLVCDGYIEYLRKLEKVSLKGLLFEVNERNEELLATSEKGVSIQKIFIDTKAKSSDVSKQKLVRNGLFAFNANTSRNSDTLSIALNREEPCAVSNTYIVFECDKKIMPEYLYLWFRRKEFDRYARFNSWGSARETISIEELEKYEIALPNIEIQKGIVNVLSAYEKRVDFINQLKRTIFSICPVLVRGAIKEAKRG
jgi:type I restriction enzyme S subunit